MQQLGENFSFFPINIYNDYVITQGNAALCEAKASFDVMELLRDTPVEMRLIETSKARSTEGLPMAYLALLTIPDLDRDVRKILSKAEKFHIVFVPRPTRENLGLTVDDQVPADALGWNARVRQDPMRQFGSFMTIWLTRPHDTEHPHYNLELPAFQKKASGKAGGVQVYIRYRPSDLTVRRELDALNIIRKGGNYQKVLVRKRDLLCGRNFTLFREVNLLDGLTEAQTATVTRNLTPSQLAAFTDYLTCLPNGIGLVQGAFGCGKTMMILRLALAFGFRNMKMLVVAGQNSPVDHVAMKLLDEKSLVAIRLYSTSKSSKFFSICLNNRPHD